MEAECASLQQQQRDLEESIKALVNRRKELESDLTMKRKALAGARAKFKDVQAKKPK
jgi:predicted  nucleic acid-binding Zn-ribbon protein